MSAVVGFKSVGLGVIEAWKMGMKFKSYRKREKVYVDWQPILSASVKFIQVSPKYHSSHQVDEYATETNFVSIQAT